MISKLKHTSIVFLVLLLAVSGSFSYAQNSTEQQITPEEKSQLQQQLLEIENQIAQYQKELNQIKGEKNTLQNKINSLKKQQASLALQTKSTKLQIEDLGLVIADTEKAIDINSEKIAKLKDEIAEVIRFVHEQDETSVLYVMLSQDSLIDAINEMENYLKISDKLQNLVNTISEANIELETQRDLLTEQQKAAEDMLVVQAQQQQMINGLTIEQNDLLKITKGKESEYQAVISNTQKQANEIRGRLYQLLGISSQITFGQAVEIAKWASGQTGVRASFLLAILTQESNLGKNVGTCNRPGDPPEKSWKVVMKPTRDQEPFKIITTELGMDIDTTPVSCPMKDKRGKQIGWGGAMGPAQFIPSTWMGYKDKVTEITGKPANPWDIRDAFLASAIKLKAGGAGTVSGEWAAAMRYFSGSTNTRYRFYGDNVVAMANKYQQDIDQLGN